MYREGNLLLMRYLGYDHKMVCETYDYFVSTIAINNIVKSHKILFSETCTNYVFQELILKITEHGIEEVEKDYIKHKDGTKFSYVYAGTLMGVDLDIYLSLYCCSLVFIASQIKYPSLFVISSDFLKDLLIKSVIVTKTEFNEIGLVDKGEFMDHIRKEERLESKIERGADVVNKAERAAEINRKMTKLRKGKGICGNKDIIKEAVCRYIEEEVVKFRKELESKFFEIVLDEDVMCVGIKGKLR